jgi:hypothetical protein
MRQSDALHHARPEQRSIGFGKRIAFRNIIPGFGKELAEGIRMGGVFHPGADLCGLIGSRPSFKEFPKEINIHNGSVYVVIR